MGKNRKVILTIAVFMALALMTCAVLLPVALTPLVNTDSFKTKVIQTVEDKLGLQVQLGRIELFLCPLPGFRARDLKLALNPYTTLSIKTAAVDLDLNRLFKLQVAPSRITLLSSKLILSGNQKDPAASLGSNQSKHDVSSLLPEIRDRLLALVPESSDGLDIIISNGSAPCFDTMDARVRLAGNTQSIDIQAKIKGARVNLHQFPMLDNVVKGRITDINANVLKVTCHHDTDTQLSVKLDITALKARRQEPESLPIEAEKLQLACTLAQNCLNARLIPGDFTFPNGRVGIEFSFNLDRNQARIQFTGDHIDIGQARQVFRPLLKGLTISDTLFRILKSGTADHIIVGFNEKEPGQLFTGENLVLQGIAHGATVKIPHVPVTVTNASGWAKMENGVLSIFPQSGRVGNTKVTGGTLEINLVHHHTSFSGRFPMKVALAELPEALIRILPETKLARELSQISQISGTADAMLELHRGPQNKGIPEVTVSATNIKAEGYYQRIPLKLHVDGGNFLLHRDTVTLKNLSGHVGHSRISNLDATVEVHDPVPMNIQNMTGNVILSEIAPIAEMFPGARQKMADVNLHSGNMEIRHLQVRGPMFNPLQWQLDMAGQVKKASVIFKNDSDGIADLSCRIQATPEKIHLSDISCIINDLNWLENKVSALYTQSIALPLILSQGFLKIAPDDNQVQGCILSPSGAQISFEADGPDFSKIRPSKVQITDDSRSSACIIFHHDPDLPRLKFSGKLDTTTIDNLLTKNSWLHQQLLEVTGKNALSIFTDQNFLITIKAQHLNLAPLVTPRKKSGSTQKVRPWTEQKQIIFDVDQLNYSNHIFHNVKAKATADKNVTQIDISEAIYCGLDFSGKITLNHTAQTQAVSTHFVFETKGESDISSAFGCLTGSNSVIEGGYRLKGEVTGTANTLGQVKFKQNGTLNFQARSGRIYKATLLSRLLSMLNILSEPDLQQEGFGFKTFTAQADVKDSVLHLKKLYIDAEDMAIIADGWADPLNDALNITFLVAPFKTIDTIIQHIPVINTILSGRLVSFPAQAYGKISNPTVVPLHPSAVGKGLLNLLEDLIKAPARLMEGVNQNEE